MAILTKPLNGRAACHYCAQCGRGCISASNFSSSQVMIPPAQATGRFTLIPNAMAREIVVGKDGKAQAVSYIDKATRTEKRVHAKAFVVAASACESARLLLNSRSTQFPNGLANSSGVVGRYLTDSVGQQRDRIFSATGEDASAQPRRRRRHAHVYAVVEVRPQERISARLPHRVRWRTRYARRGRVRRSMQRARGLWRVAQAEVPQHVWHFIGFSGRGEMIPNPDTYCEIDPEVVDQVGDSGAALPLGNGATTRSRWRRICRKRFASIVEAAGGTVVDGARRADTACKNAGNQPQEQVAVRHLRRRRDHSRSWEQCGWGTIRRPRC